MVKNHQNNLNSDIKTQKINILLAEDNEIILKIALSTLKSDHFKFHVARNGQEVIDFFEKGKYDLILMDIQMPELDGIQVTELIRNKEKSTGCHIPIVALTACSQDEDKKKCLEIGMDYFVQKPLKKADLELIIDKFIIKSSRNISIIEDKGKTDNYDFSFFDQIGEQGSRRLLNQYSIDLPLRIEKLKKSIININYDEIISLTHSLRGLLYYLKMFKSAETASKLEIMAREQCLDDALGLYNDLNISIDDLIIRFQAYLKSL